MAEARRLWGLLAEFATADALLEAARAARADGHGQLEAYSPFPIEGLAEAVAFKRSRVPVVTLLGALSGGLSGYLMQWYSAVVAYPIDVGGRPLHSWPMFVPVSFELAVLGGRWPLSAPSSSATACPTWRTRSSRRRTSTSRCATGSSSACAPVKRPSTPHAPQPGSMPGNL